MCLKYVNFFCGVLLTSSSLAASALSSFPRGCEVSGFGFSGSNLVINNHDKQAYYLIQNISSHPLIIQRVGDHEVFASPSLSAKLAPKRWAALAADINNLNLTCMHVDSELNEKVSCRDVIDICQYPRVKFALSNMGNYWVSVDRDQRQVINDSTAKGIYLRW